MTERTTFEESYSGALSSSNLRSIERTSRSPADLVHAAGLAAVSNRFTMREGRPLAVALLRMLVGGHSSDHKRVERVLAVMICNRAEQWHRIRIRYGEAEFIARTVVIWFRDGRCKTCGGHGFKKLEGSPALSDVQCRDCRGGGKVNLEALFEPRLRELVSWVIASVEREASRAGPAAMEVLAPSLDL